MVEEDLLAEEDEPDDTVPQSADEIVSASLLRGALSDACDISVTMCPLDIKEEDLVKTFADHGCKCTLGPNKSPCCRLFAVDHYLSLRCAFAELTHTELDMMVMGEIMSTCFHSPKASGQSSSPTAVKTTHNFQHSYHHDHRVCQPTFLFLHTIGIKRFKNVKASFLKNGPAGRVHGNTGRKPKCHLTLEQIEDVVQFIQNYTSRQNKVSTYTNVHVCA